MVVAAAPPRLDPRVLLGLVIAFIVYATTLPFDLAHAPTLENAELIPFWDPVTGRLHSIPDMVQNVALFVPFGALLVPSWPALARRGESWVGLVVVAVAAALLGLALSGCVEALQTMSLVRRPSATDLATNTLGAMLGAGAWALVVPRAEPLLTRIAGRRVSAPARLVALGWLGITAVATLAPFVPSLDVGHLRAKARLVLDDPLGLASLGSVPVELVTGLALGAALAVAASSPPRRTLESAALGAALSVAINAAIEVLQFPLLHHQPGLLAFSARALGGVIGAILGARLATRAGAPPPLGGLTRTSPVSVFALLIAGPLLAALAPFELLSSEALAAKLSPDTLGPHLVPFGLLFANLQLGSLTHVFEVALTAYAPLGWCLAALGRSGRAAFGWAFLMAEVLEVLQLPIAGRTFDVTEGLIAASGAVLGAWALGRARLLVR